MDDSAFMRKMISSIIEAGPGLYVAGKARNGLDALEKIERLKPDVITLDIEMPELDGLSTLRRIMEKAPLPVMMLCNDAESTMEAFELGAVDFMLKEELVGERTETELHNFHTRLAAASQANFPLPAKTMPEKPAVPIPPAKQLGFSQKVDLAVIGSSTGGPAALQKILTRIPRDFPIPLLVIQHIPPGFTRPLAERFNKLCEVTVKEAEHDEELLPGSVYIAPAGLQTTLQKKEPGKYVIKLKTASPIETLYKPSVDVALLSAAPLAGNRLLAVILTGMGDDGLRGCRKVKEYGGAVLAEAEETCIVYGMPKVVFEAGLADEQAPLYSLYDSIMNHL